MHPDNVFFRLKEVLTPDAVALIAGGELKKATKAKQLLTGFAGCESASTDDIIFVDNKKYVSALRESKASCVLLSRRLERFIEWEMDSTHVVLCDNARIAFVKVMGAVYEPKYQAASGISKTAVVSTKARLADNVVVGEHSVIESDCNIGEGTQIGHQVSIGAGVVLGKGCKIDSQVSITHAVIGDDVVIASGTRIGQHGFGMVETAQGFLDIPHNGRVVIGNNVVIGANVAIDRGTMGDTVVGDGCRIGDLALISHNVCLGSHCAMAGQSAVAGSTVVGDGVHFGGQSGVAEHLKIGNNVRILGQTGVIEDLGDNAIVAGTPALPVKSFFKLVKMLKNFGVG